MEILVGVGLVLLFFFVLASRSRPMGRREYLGTVGGIKGKKALGRYKSHAESYFGDKYGVKKVHHKVEKHKNDKYTLKSYGKRLW